MATCATQPGRRLHRHLPEPKTTLSMAGRLRLELNRTVRTTVAQAVDAVWVAYEDELTKMTAPLDERAKDYELFHVCCRRLVDFIAHNMETTPGFVEQMDRLILACHSGATGSTVHSVMTRDLRIRRCSKENHVDVKTEPSMTDDKVSPVISPLNGTIDMARREVENAVTIGLRQWTTRKRLSISSHPLKNLRSKRLKRSVPSESKSEEPEDNQDDAEETQEQSHQEKKRGKDKQKKMSTRHSLRPVKAVKRPSRRMRVRRLEQDLENAQDTSESANEEDEDEQGEEEKTQEQNHQEKKRAKEKPQGQSDMNMKKRGKEKQKKAPTRNSWRLVDAVKLKRMSRRMIRVRRLEQDLEDVQDISESENEEDENKQDEEEQSHQEKKRDKEEKPRRQNDMKKRGKEKQKKVSSRNSLRPAKAVKRTSRRMTSVRGLEKDLEDVQDTGSNRDDGAEHENVRHVKPAKKIRWNLRSRSKSTNDSNESNAVQETFSNATVRTESEEDMTEENGSESNGLDTQPVRKKTTSEEEQTDTTFEHEEPISPEAPDVEMTSNVDDCAEAEETQENVDKCSEVHETEVTMSTNHAECEVDDGENESNVNADDSSHEHHAAVVPEVEDLGSAAFVGNDQTHSVGTPVDTPGDESDINMKTVYNTGTALPKAQENQEDVREPEFDEATSAQNATESQGAKAADEFDQNKDATTEVDQEQSIPGLCDAGMRTSQQVSHFKACLRKSIQFVDAVFCNPPQGKHCFRNCRKIRSRQCSEDVPCRDKFCRNWHDTEAHTERCKNPLCEFTNRVFLREVMHQIANHDVETRLLQLQWEEKVTELTLVTTGSTNEQYTPDKLASLEDEVEELEQRIDSAKVIADSLMDKKRGFLVNLSAIGIMPQDDAGDGFPDFETHYR